jgi:hypothetical protein
LGRHEAVPDQLGNLLTVGALAFSRPYRFTPREKK